MKRLLIATAAMLMMSGSALAQETQYYAGVGLGAFGVEIKDSSVGLNQKNTVFGGYAKFGADFTDYVAAELRVGTTGTGTTTYPAGSLGVPAALGPFDFKQSSNYFFSYLLKVKLPVSQDFRVYGLLGGTTGKVKGELSLLGVSASQSKTKTGFSYGVGGEFDVTNQLSVGAEWVQYWTNVKLDNTTKAKLWGAVGTLTYHF